jgi:AmpD protein
MKIDAATGLLDDARFIASPNCDARPAGAAVDVIVIHAISLPPGKFGGPGIEELFCNRLKPAEDPSYGEICKLRVSAHFLVRRGGEIVQFVPLHQRAWHAGRSYCEGRKGTNDFSVGIELEGSDDVPFEEAQYRALSVLTQEIMNVYPAITPDRIYGHADIAPGRKTDPGPNFHWDRFLASLPLAPRREA